MKVLVVGAGALGGYFGGRLLEIGRDVTFLVRPRRAEQLRANGLVAKSPKGDFRIANPSYLLASELAGKSFDLILLSNKAYNLDAAMNDFSPAVGAGTAILPLLNGMRHLDVMDARFGAAHVLGGRCNIAATLDADGTVRHLSDFHDIIYGERDGTRSPRIAAIEALMTGANYNARASDVILQEMWEKWVMLGTLAASNCLFRGSVGDIIAGGGGEAVMAMLAESIAIATRAGHPPRPPAEAAVRANLSKAGSPFSASMLRDLDQGCRVEADHVVGDLIARAGDLPVPMLRLAYAVLKTYEARKLREAK